MSKPLLQYHQERLLDLVEAQVVALFMRAGDRLVIREEIQRIREQERTRAWVRCLYCGQERPASTLLPGCWTCGMVQCEEITAEVMK